MKIKDLKDILNRYDEELDLFFEEDGHNFGGETEIFSLFFHNYGKTGDDEFTIRFKGE